MAANISDVFNESTTNDRPAAATLTAIKASGATTLTVDSTTGWPTATAVHFTMYEVDADNDKLASTQRDYKGIVNSATTINNVTVKGGADREFPIGAKVICAPTAAWADDLVNGVLVEHNQDGTHKDVNADTLTTPTLNDVALADVGLLGNEEYYTSNDTWTKPDNLKFIIVEVQAGGGGGAGCPTATNSGASGGGGGGYALKKILAADLAATVAVTVGAGGAGGAAGTNDGVDGSSSSFGSHASATGGSKGLTSGSSIGGAGGVGTGGDINIDGGYGFGGETAAPPTAGAGGASKLGIGGGGGKGSFSGKDGTGYGSGGSAGCRVNTGGQPGGAGSAGIVIVHEYY